MQVLGNCARCDGLHGSGLSLALPDRAQRRLGVDWASRSTALASYIATTSDPAPTGSTDDRTGSIGSLKATKLSTILASGTEKCLKRERGANAPHHTLYCVDALEKPGMRGEGENMDEIIRSLGGD